MQYGSQSGVLDFLKAGARGSPCDVQVVETHISIVLLQGDRAWKLKRALHLPYADFSSPELRLAACEREIELNRRTAPSIYLGVRRITLETDGSLTIDGTGTLVDAVVEMRRFDEDTLFSRLAANGRLDRALLTRLAGNIAAFHRAAEIRSEDGAANIRRVLALNEQATDLPAVLGPAPVQQLRLALHDGLNRLRPLLEARASEGRIRLCHGDLHLRNLCLVDGEPTLFDCIEFNDDLATVDTLYDLAFLLMDLWQAGLKAEANWVMNRYLDASDDSSGLPLLPFFMALRASIRAQVLATQAALPDTPERNSLTSQARAYLNLGLALLRTEPVRLLAIGGLSGSGKSTLAAALAEHLGPAPGARILSSDRLRKQLAGVPAETRLPPHSYTPESSQRVYATLYAQAFQTLATGHSVIADAVFSRNDERDAIEACATRAAVAFQGFWLDTDPTVLLERVEARRDDPSDATTEVVKAQLQRHHTPPEWLTLPACDRDILQDAARAAIEQAAQQAVPTGDSPPAWSQAPAGWDWLAQDADGNWYWYAVAPQPGLPGGVWRSPRRAQQLAARGTPNPSWYESCRQRPATSAGDTKETQQ